MKKILPEFVPPIVRRITGKMRKVLTQEDSKWEFGVEQPPAYYDEKFVRRDHWRQHYTESRYYPLWAIIVDRIERIKPELILDVGCGSGQFANLLQDKHVEKYIGVDFSPARIEWARKICPEFRFEVEDVFKSNIIEATNADCVVFLEFLEHIEKDIDVISKVREGAYVIASVPNFPATGHVRYFESVGEVITRYEPFFSKIRVDEHLANREGERYYLIEGIR